MIAPRVSREPSSTRQMSGGYHTNSSRALQYPHRGSKGEGQATRPRTDPRSGNEIDALATATISTNPDGTTLPPIQCKVGTRTTGDRHDDFGAGLRWLSSRTDSNVVGGISKRRRKTGGGKARLLRERGNGRPDVLDEGR